ncbi:MAG TPA: BMC domain-containing protein [Tepidisphaeraceae bacterium]|jgi:microcompartment protein CcmL/EutN|nr:BMC domain-containing protein [Tepidisphaeraceae bacterium]
MQQALGILEIRGYTPAMVALDAAEKAGEITLIQLELNDFYGVVLKLAGAVGSVRAAVQAGEEIARLMHADVIATIIPNPAIEAMTGILAKEEFSPLIEQAVVKNPKQERAMADQATFAIGMIETQGFAAVIEAVDTACKAANVEVLGKEKLGGGYVTILIKGDVAAVKAAVEAGKSRVEGLGKLIAAHVIPRPSTAVLSLLPKA